MPSNIYLNLTPEQAMELSTKLLRIARDVNDAIENQGRPDAYEYLPIGTTEPGTGEFAVRMRIGAK